MEEPFNKRPNNRKTQLTVGIIARGYPESITRLLNDIQHTPGLYLVYHRRSKMRLILSEEPFEEGGGL